MKIINLLELIFFFIFTGCSNPLQDKHENNDTSLESSNQKLIYCDSILYLLIQTADIPSYLKNKTLAQDGIENDTMLIKISHRNEVEPGAFVDAADGFLKIDLKNYKLLEVIIEIDSLKEINCNKIILDSYIDNCIK